MSNLYLPIEERREIILRYAQTHGLHNFVETGTADGSTTAAMVQYFDQLYTIEIDSDLYCAAVERFKPLGDKVKCYWGDSGEVLPRVIKELDGPALFWLDGHYCGGSTRGIVDSPIIQELAACWYAQIGSVILIDDARIFGGGAEEGLEGYTGYPHQDWIKGEALSFGYVPEIKDDIIRLVAG